MKNILMLSFLFACTTTEPTTPDGRLPDLAVEPEQCPKRPPPSCGDPPAYFPEENPKFLTDGVVIVTESEYAKIREFKDRASIWIQCRLNDDRYGQ